MRHRHRQNVIAGMQQLQSARAERATKAAIEAGNVSQQSVSKMRRHEKNSKRRAADRLDEDSGAFKGA